MLCVPEGKAPSSVLMIREDFIEKGESGLHLQGLWTSGKVQGILHRKEACIKAGRLARHSPWLEHEENFERGGWEGGRARSRSLGRSYQEAFSNRPGVSGQPPKQLFSHESFMSTATWWSCR